MNSKNLSQQRYSKFADGYVTSQTHAKGHDLNRLVEIANPQPDWVVLDVATGGGHTALKFAPFVQKVIATDITPKMLAKAQVFITNQGIKNIEFKPADAENLPFDDETFDLVTCRIAPHHFPDCAQFVQEGARVLKPEGLLLVQDHLLPEDETAVRYVDDFERLRDPSHNRAYSQAEWLDMFTAAGFDVQHTEKVIKRHDFIAWTERQGCSSEIIKQLRELLTNAPKIATDWLMVENIMSAQASFANHHLLILGRK